MYPIFKGQNNLENANYVWGRYQHSLHIHLAVNIHAIYTKVTRCSDSLQILGTNSDMIVIFIIFV